MRNPAAPARLLLVLPKKHSAAIYLFGFFVFHCVSQLKGRFDRGTSLGAGLDLTGLYSCSSRSVFTLRVMYSRFTKCRDPISQCFAPAVVVQPCSCVAWGREGSLFCPGGGSGGNGEEVLCHLQSGFMKSCFSAACCKDKLG